MRNPTYLGSWLSDAVHDVAGWAVGNGNEPGDPLTRRGEISDDQLAQELAAATLAQPPPAVTVKQALILGAGGLAVFLIMRKR